MKLIQAGYMDPRAVGMFFLVRFGGFVALRWPAHSLPTLGGQRRCRRMTAAGPSSSWPERPAISCPASC